MSADRMVSGGELAIARAAIEQGGTARQSRSGILLRGSLRRASRHSPRSSTARPADRSFVVGFHQRFQRGNLVAQFLAVFGVGHGSGKFELLNDLHRRNDVGSARNGVGHRFEVMMLREKSAIGF